MLSSSIPAELFPSEAHHFEHFPLKSPKTIEQLAKLAQSQHKNVPGHHDFDLVTCRDKKSNFSLFELISLMSLLGIVESKKVSGRHTKSKLYL